MTKKNTKILAAVVLTSLILTLGFATLVFWSARTVVKPAMPPGVQALRRRNLDDIEDVIEAYDNRRLTTKDLPWILFHGLLGRLHDYTISDQDGKTYSCVNWLLTEVSCKPIFKHTPLAVMREWGISFTHGPTPQIKKEFEDHFCQFLFILMELGISPEDTVICIPPNGDDHVLVEVVQAEESFCHGHSDLSWALPVFARWSTRREWTNKFGSEFNLNRLMAQHLKRERSCDSCFGTHWRMGLALGLKYGYKKISIDLRIQAEQRLSETIIEARNSQDETGQFRLQWGLYPPKPSDINDLPPLPRDAEALLSHQGHMLEWLMVALTDEELSSLEWPHRGISCLLTKLRNTERDILYGTHSHCAHALRLYQKRMNNLIYEWQPSKLKGLKRSAMNGCSLGNTRKQSPCADERACALRQKMLFHHERCK